CHAGGRGFEPRHSRHSFPFMGRNWQSALVLVFFKIGNFVAITGWWLRLLMFVVMPPWLMRRPGAFAAQWVRGLA
ncbi:MAG: hypothetical protein ACKOUM_03960, partial [Sphingopyxis sp.]